MRGCARCAGGEAVLEGVRQLLLLLRRQQQRRQLSNSSGGGTARISGTASQAGGGGGGGGGSRDAPLRHDGGDDGRQGGEGGVAPRDARLFTLLGVARRARRRRQRHRPRTAAHRRHPHRCNPRQPRHPAARLCRHHRRGSGGGGRDGLADRHGPHLRRQTGEGGGAVRVDGQPVQVAVQQLHHVRRRSGTRAVRLGSAGDRHVHVHRAAIVDVHRSHREAENKQRKTIDIQILDRGRRVPKENVPSPFLVGISGSKSPVE